MKNGRTRVDTTPGIHTDVPVSGNLVSRDFGAMPGPVRRMALRIGWRLLDFRDEILRELTRERDRGGVFNQFPVALGLGAMAYFMAPAEPLWFVTVASALACILIAMRMRVRATGYVAFMALGLFFAGMSAAQIRTQQVAAPVIGSQVTGEIRGVVIWRDSSSRGNSRYLIRPTGIEGLQQAQLPNRIRLTASAGHEPIRPGESIAGLARISPFSGPFYPGGYDFAFVNWYGGLGGSGYFMGRPRGMGAAAAGDTTLIERMAIVTSRLRLAIANRIEARLVGEDGAIAIALITGDRSRMSSATQDSLRKSGLAHVLAISGLHMALVTLTVFWTIRFCLALIPGIALHYPIRKIAAVGGLTAATAYLALSGASIATQRAWIMLAIMLLATFLDRRAVTIRNLVLAAGMILIIAPESLLQPGFQMSFAAAGSLVAAYSGLRQWRENRMAKSDQYAQAGPLSPRSWFAFLAGLAFTSLIAGLATAPFSAWHFHQVAPLGLVTNLLAMPVISLGVMPLALLSALAMPYGLEAIPLYPLGRAISLVVAISDHVNEAAPWNGGSGLLPTNFILLASAGLILLVLLTTRLRFLGLVPIACLPLALTPPEAPDLIIAQDGRAIAIRDRDGRLAMPYPGRGTFVTDIWLSAWSNGSPGSADEIVGPCDNDLCLMRSSRDIRIAIVYAPEMIDRACHEADILAAPRLWWINCDGRKPAVILKRADFERLGTHLLHFEEIAAERKSRISSGSNSEEHIIETASGHRFNARIATTLRADDRPWNRARLASIPEH